MAITIVAPIVVRRASTLLSFAGFVIIYVHLPSNASVLVNVRRIKFVGPFERLCAAFMAGLQFALFALLYFSSGRAANDSQAVGANQDHVFRRLGQFGVHQISVARIVISYRSIGCSRQIELHVR